ncbi:putative cytoplasmic dynein intermediate chain [Toxoplasma gondii GAB2-2007-GAL-DOM2]|uniref:Putative cytoplasmic dynein intermediate chain n=1 Tax=Toxoplasma gondii GAB2-2007-GAL-DOM2 TaxID=1130820 RepID=A0A086JQ34_TOXGO|nr:putative cytoplasmic dynein intermediate chain [Toxoplasma gondii GAB2-2007-GAL-DOM2]
MHVPSRVTLSAYIVAFAYLLEEYSCINWVKACAFVNAICRLRRRLLLFRYSRLCPSAVFQTFFSPLLSTGLSSCGAQNSLALTLRSFAQPLKTFDDFEVYIYDAAWHPTNPALFSCVDGEGHIDLWNLANDWETPAIRVGGTEHGMPPVAKNKVVWSSDGRRMVTGDAKGNVEVWALASELLQLRGDEAANFERQIEEAKPDNAPSNVDIANDISMEFTE